MGVTCYKKQGYLNIGQVAALWGVPKVSLINARTALPGFPKQHNSGKEKLYNPAELQAWVEGKDVLNMVRAVLAERQKNRKANLTSDTSSSAFNLAARAFISGAYLPAAQKQAIEFKKLTARVTQPQTLAIKPPAEWQMKDYNMDRSTK